ncbi:unnamed protein product [Musa textilis]
MDLVLSTRNTRLPCFGQMIEMLSYATYPNSLAAVSASFCGRYMYGLDWRSERRQPLVSDSIGKASVKHDNSA